MMAKFKTMEPGKKETLTAAAKWQVYDGLDERGTPINMKIISAATAEEAMEKYRAIPKD